MIIITPTAQAAAAQASDASQGEELRRANAESLKGERAAQINSVSLTTSKETHHKMNQERLPEQSNTKGAKQPHLLMRPRPIVHAHNMDDSSKQCQIPTAPKFQHNKENMPPSACPVRPRFRIVSRSPYHRPRHHNPGTRYRPDPRLHRHPDRRIRILSTVKVVPPPIPTEQPSSSRNDSTRPTYRRPMIGEIAPKWRKPTKVDISPVASAWKQERALVPPPVADYRHGFNIFPGEAYQTVLWAEDPEARWPPQPIEVEPPGRPKYHDTSGTDPRSLDLRIRLNQLRIGDLRQHLNKKQAAREEPSETPEEAIARLHGELPVRQDPPTQPSPAEISTDRLPPPNWTGPPRRRRRCRLVVIYKNEKQPAPA